jgi:hypothetical protein
MAKGLRLLRLIWRDMAIWLVRQVVLAHNSNKFYKVRVLELETLALRILTLGLPTQILLVQMPLENCKPVKGYLQSVKLTSKQAKPIWPVVFNLVRGYLQSVKLTFKLVKLTWLVVFKLVRDYLQLVNLTFKPANLIWLGNSRLVKDKPVLALDWVI